MKHLVCWITGTAAILLLALCAVFIIMGMNYRPGDPAVLAYVLIGMTCGVIAATLGAISMMTYQTPFERRHHRNMSRIADTTLTRANAVARYSPSDGLELATRPTTPGQP